MAGNRPTMRLSVFATPTEVGREIGKKEFKLEDIYDMGLLADGSNYVLRCSIEHSPLEYERVYIDLAYYEITISEKWFYFKASKPETIKTVEEVIKESENGEKQNGQAK